MTQNLLLEDIQYKIDETAFGIWRRFLYPSGQYFAEFRSHARFLGLPLLHYTRGKCPETGRRVVARGIVAIGRIATGVIAVGQASAGIIAFGQASVGLLFGMAQATAGYYAIGQLALGVTFGAGQIATGITAVGQIAVGRYVLAQLGFGTYLWTPKQSNPIAVHYFHTLWDVLRSCLSFSE
jgi:hypothetical protein